MGAWFSRRDQRSSFKKQLEELDSKIESVAEKKQVWTRRQRWLVSRFLMLSVLIELGLIGYWYLWFYHLRYSDLQTSLGPLSGIGPLQQHAIRFGAILFYPILVFFLSKTISGYFRRKLEKADDLVKELREDQIRKLNQLMEMTDFTFIQNYHEKIRRQNPHLFRNQPPLSALNQLVPTTAPPATPKKAAAPKAAASTPAPQPSTPKAPVISTPSTPLPPATPTQPITNAGPVGSPLGSPPNLRQRPVNQVARQAVQNQAAAQQQQQRPIGSPVQPPPPRQYTMPAYPAAPPPTPPPQRPVEPGQRTFFNRMVDWIIGDGPENSVNQICEKCKRFNGTIPKEESTFNQFTCYYCKHPNGQDIPQVLTNPILPKFPPPIQQSTTASSSSSQSSSSSSPSTSKPPAKDEPLVPLEEEKEPVATEESGRTTPEPETSEPQNEQEQPESVQEPEKGKKEKKHD